MATVYKVISTAEQKREGANYNPSSYNSFNEALKQLEGTINELNRMGGFFCYPVSKVCYEITALYAGYSKKLGSIYIKKVVEE